MIGGRCIKTWNTTQGPIALSSVEAEYYSMVDVAMSAIGMKNMALEIGALIGESQILMHTDSIFAKSFSSRRGFGKIPHMETRALWLQEAVASRKVILLKVRGEQNPADLLTKCLNREAIECHLGRMGVRAVRRDRAIVRPAVDP